MKHIVALFTLVNASFYSAFALAGTVGVYLVPDDQIVEVSPDGGHVSVMQPTFEFIHSNAKCGDKIGFAGKDWMVTKTSADTIRLEMQTDKEQMPVELKSAE